MKKFIPLLLLSFLLFNCGNKDQAPNYAKDRTTETEQSAPVLDESEIADPNDPMNNKGIGPISSVQLAETVDQEMAITGKAIYEAKCTACHKPTEVFVGPPQKGVLDRRSPEWVMNMILNPVEMQEKDPIAKALVKEFNGAAMVDMNLTEEEARQVLEYIRTIE